MTEKTFFVGYICNRVDRVEAMRKVDAPNIKSIWINSEVDYVAELHKMLPDLILLNAYHEKSFFDIAAKIKSNEELAHIPVAAIIAPEDMTYINRSMAEVIDAFIPENNEAYILDMVNNEYRTYEMDDAFHYKRKILVVDDDPTYLSSISYYLFQEGYRIIGARDGEEALSKAKIFIPDVILLDYMLPKVHGLQVMRDLRDTPYTKHIPIVVNSEHDISAIDDNLRNSPDIQFNSQKNDRSMILRMIESQISVSQTMYCSIVPEDVVKDKDFKIVIVEDEVSISDILAKYLSRKLNVDVVVVNDGAQAYDLLIEEKPDLILLDLMLPGVCGIDLLKIIKSHNNLKDIPVIMETGLSDTASVKTCIDLGACDYMVKPPSLELLKEKVTKFMAEKKSVSPKEDSADIDATYDLDSILNA